jgi:hypothetical protein
MLATAMPPTGCNALGTDMPAGFRPHLLLRPVRLSAQQKGKSGKEKASSSSGRTPQNAV